jgi:hypothetical protein
MLNARHLTHPSTEFLDQLSSVKGNLIIFRRGGTHVGNGLGHLDFDHSNLFAADALNRSEFRLSNFEFERGFAAV